MIPLNYHHLYYFWTVARAGSIGAGTQRLYLSQPALSSQLKELERACGATLFERGRKGVTLTYEGRLVFESCERIFGEGEELAALIRGRFTAPATLRVGVQPSVTREVVLRLLDFLRKTDPAGRATVVSAEAETLAAKLRHQEVDLVVANEDCSARLGRDFAGRLVSQLPVHFVASRLVRRLVRRFPEDLTASAMLLRPADNPVRKQVDEFLARRRLDVRVEADSSDVEFLRRLAVGGRGVAVLSALSVEADLKAGRLVMLNRAPTGIEEAVWFACPLRLRASPALRGLIDAAMKRFSVFGRPPRVASRLGD